jgi:hypothetical protein
MSYTPQPCTIPAKAVDYLRVQAQAGRMWVPAVEIEDYLDQCPIGPYLERAVNHGLLRKEQMTTDRRRSQYALGDGKPLPARPRDQDEPLPPKATKKPMQAPWPPVFPPPPTNPSPGASVKAKTTKKGQPANYVDPDTLSIGHDPMPKGRVTFNKYTEIFNRLKFGDCLKCAPNEVAQIANSLRKWLSVNEKPGQVRTVRHYPSDNRGRVWLMAPEKGAK